MYVPEQGDIAWLDFEPSAGQEIRKRRPAFIVSKKAFNKLTGFAIVAPITNTVKGMGLEIVLKSESTQGAILIYQMRSLDFSIRNAELIETASGSVVAEAIEKAQLVVS